MTARRWISERLSQGIAQLPHLGRALRLVWRAAPGYTAAWAVLLAVQGLLPVAAVYLTRAVVDSLVSVLGSGADWRTARHTIVLAVLLAAVLLATEVVQAVVRWLRTAQAEIARDHMAELVHARAVEVDYAYYETPEYFDTLHRIRYDVASRPSALLDSAGALAQNTLTLVAMFAVLLRFGVWIPLALLASTVPALLVVLRYVVRQHEWRLRTTPDERRAFYYDWLMTAQEAAAEVRLFGLGDHFRSVYRELRHRLRDERLAMARQEGLAGLFGAGFALLATAGALAWMVVLAMRGSVSLGELAMFYQAFSQGQRLMRSLLESAGQIYQNSLFLDNLFAFLDLRPLAPPAGARPVPARLRQGLSFRGVRFRYPGGSRLVLPDFDLDIPAGRVVAVVGTNGAGKSTLIKLICRLFDPEAGVITLDGADLREYRVEELRRAVTVLFQEPLHYHASMLENIRVGDLTGAGDRAAVEAAARAAGADEIAARLPEGYETMLGRYFATGTELSVGQWQRIALARAFFRPSPLILLDEPTSAMDSWAEAEWMERFADLARGRTVLLITHRFTTAMKADVIHVMDAGRIVESGSHAELLESRGRYAASWTAQMRQVSSASAPGLEAG